MAKGELKIDIKGEKLSALIGAEVSLLKLGDGIHLVLYGGKDREKKYAELCIEADFELSSNTAKFEITPSNITTLPPVLKLLKSRVTGVEYLDETITLNFSNGYGFTVKPVPKFEAWTLTGDDFGFYIASPI
jgi:hypothetical protein